MRQELNGKLKLKKYIPKIRKIALIGFLGIAGLIGSVTCEGCAAADENEIRIEDAESGFSLEEDAGAFASTDTKGNAAEANGSKNADSSAGPGASGQQDLKAGSHKKTARTVVVHVCGMVEQEGVYELADGKRVADALEAAGGAKESADLTQLNLAAVLEDGQKILVPEKQSAENAGAADAGEDAGANDTADANAEAGGSPDGHASTDSKAGTGDSSVININTADISQLTQLPGIGEARASAIIEYRQENGPFATPEEIMNISGIKQNAYKKIKDRIRV